MATAVDDFSFPTTTNPPPLFIGSPPLWRRASSTRSPRKELITERKPPKEDDEEGESCNSNEKSLNRSKERKSFSYVERGPKAAQDQGGCRDDGEEKMDLLWEDFNEELSRIQGSPGQRAAANQFGCVPGNKLLLKSGRGSGGTVCRSKRPGMVVFIEVLKRVFSLHSSHRTVKKRSC